MTDYGLIRVSTGSQDAQTQRRDILRASPMAVIITTDTKAASASKGEQLDALDAVIAGLRKGDRVIVKTSGGEVMAKELTRKTGQKVELKSLNPAHPDVTLPLNDIQWIPRILWVSQ